MKKVRKNSSHPCRAKWCACWSIEGQAVEAGQSILVVEAMKMQNEIKSPKKGTVQKIVATEGANVNAGDVLAIVE